MKQSQFQVLVLSTNLDKSYFLIEGSKKVEVVPFSRENEYKVFDYLSRLQNRFHESFVKHHEAECTKYEKQIEVTQKLIDDLQKYPLTYDVALLPVEQSALAESIVKVYGKQFVEV